MTHILYFDPDEAPPPEELYVVREAALRDLHWMMQIEDACFPQDAWAVEDLLSWFSDEDTYAKVIEHSEFGVVAAAYYHVDYKASELALVSIGVDPLYRGEGLGKALMTAIETTAMVLGLERVVLEVRVSNERANALYEKRGYKLLSRVKGYYGNEDAYRLYKPVNQ